MKSVKITAAERKEREKKYKDGCMPCSIDGGDAYPYGLRIDLNDDTLDKLDMSTLPSVGKSMTLTAKVKVIAVRESQREGGRKDRNVELQITDLEFGATSVTDAVMDAVKKA